LSLQPDFPQKGPPQHRRGQAGCREGAKRCGRGVVEEVSNRAKNGAKSMQSESILLFSKMHHFCFRKSDAGGKEGKNGKNGGKWRAGERE